MSTTAAELWCLSKPELALRLRQGHAIDPAALAGFAYRGVSLGLPRWIDALMWKTFLKVFHLGPAGLRGWNVRLHQDGLQAPVRRQTVRSGLPRSFGHFGVCPLRPEGPAADISAGLLLDYGSGGNPRLDPTARIRDPVVAVDSDRTDLLLGWTYVDLGIGFVGTPSFFTLERVGPLTHVVAPPCPAVGLITRYEVGPPAPASLRHAHRWSGTTR
jgi:hypothetical protein